MKILRLPEVLSETGMSRSTIYRLMADGLWPHPVHSGARMIAWPENEIAALNAARIVGSSDDQVRALVVRLTRKRLHCNYD